MEEVWSKQWQFLGVWVLVSAALYKMSGYWLVSLLSSSLIAIVLADFLLKFYNICVIKRLTIMEVQNKAIIVTGCDTGFGFKVSTQLADLGFKVFSGCLSTESDGAKTLSENDMITVVKMDVTSQNDIDQAHETIKNTLKENGDELWGIVNNAGVAMFGEVEFLKLSQYRRCLDVNTFGPVRVTKTFLPLLRQAGRGRIVNVVSRAGRFTPVGFSAYSMSKHALVSFSDGLRLDMKKWNITVHTIEPIMYKTDLINMDRIKADFASQWEEASDELKTAYGKQYFDSFVDASEKATCSYARPHNKIHEVIDDIIDAVAGEEPKICYVPSYIGKLISKMFWCLPFEVRDNIALRLTTDVKPAAAK